MPRQTCLVVAQRISTVLRADKIVVIDKGRIVAEGTHKDLMSASPIYQEIYESQLGEGIRLDGPASRSKGIDEHPKNGLPDVSP
jgi:ATP-binding cassette subfamily B protein